MVEEPWVVGNLSGMFQPEASGARSISVTRAKRDEQGRLLYGVQWFGPVTAAAPQVGQPVHYFELGAGPVVVK